MPALKRMGTKLLVAVGSDGVTDWVRLPNGQKMNLGPISVLKFVTTLGHHRSARQVIDAVLAGDEAMLSVDADLLWDLLTPRRVRWAADSFMSCDPRTARETMTTIREDLGHLEVHIQELRKFAKTATAPEMAEGREILARLTHALKAPDMASFLATLPKKASAPAAEPLSFDTINANTTLGNEIVAKAEATIAQIDKLAATRKFNAARAKADVLEVTTKVAGIMRHDLTGSWVQDDLRKLASRNDQIHALFFPKKA